MSKMNKVVIMEFGDESKLAIVEDDLPDPAAGEVQLSVEYSIVSGSDVNMRRGTYAFQREAPLTPGYSVLGKVRVNGKGCTKFKVGDRVACLSKYDGQAELINLPERFLVRVPDGVDLKAAVSLVLDWVTAYQMLHQAAHIKSGQKIFVHGLRGGVGVALLSLGRIRGAQVFGTASLSKHEELRRLGAVPFDYSNKNWITAMQELGGVDAVFDPLGFESFDESYSVLRKGGILVGYGMNLPALTKRARPSASPAILNYCPRICSSGLANEPPSSASAARRRTSYLIWSCSLNGLGPEKSSCRSRLPSGLKKFRRHIGNMPAVRAWDPS